MDPRGGGALGTGVPSRSIFFSISCSLLDEMAKTNKPLGLTSPIWEMLDRVNG